MTELRSADVLCLHHASCTHYISRCSHDQAVVAYVYCAAAGGCRVLMLALRVKPPLVQLYRNMKLVGSCSVTEAEGLDSALASLVLQSVAPPPAGAPALHCCSHMGGSKRCLQCLRSTEL